MVSDESLINDFRNGNTASLGLLYREHRRDFVRWALGRYSVEREEAEDVFSDAVVDVYQNIVSGRYQKNPGASLKSYLYEVGKYKILNILNKNRITGNHHRKILASSEYSYQIDNEGFAGMADKVASLMNAIDEKCRQVLSLYYFHNLSMEHIAREMGFKNDDVAKNKKLKCLRRLQALAFNRISPDDIYD